MNNDLSTNLRSLVSARITKGLLYKIDRDAKKQNLTKSEFIRKLLLEYYEKTEIKGNELLSFTSVSGGTEISEKDLWEIKNRKKGRYNKPYNVF